MVVLRGQACEGLAAPWCNESRRASGRPRRMKQFPRINPSVPTDSEVQAPPVVEVEREVVPLDLATPHVRREGQMALHVSEPWRGRCIERGMTERLIHREAVRDITQDGAPSQEGAGSREVFHRFVVRPHGGAPP
jgi:hypothetical protein